MNEWAVIHTLKKRIMYALALISLFIKIVGRGCWKYVVKYFLEERSAFMKKKNMDECLFG